MFALIIIFVLLGCLFAIAIPSDAVLEEEVRDAFRAETMESLTSEGRPSAKCAYCGCTNDHIYGTCDYCGASLSEE